MMSDESQTTDLEKIRNYAKKLTEDAYILALSHFYRANWWGKLHYFWGGAAIIFSALAGTSLLYDPPEFQKIAGLFALSSSIIIALVTFAKPHKEEQDHYRAGSRFIALYYKAWVIWKVESARNNEEEKNLYDKLYKLIKEMEEIDKISPRIPESTWIKALDNCKNHFDESYVIPVKKPRWKFW